jgi:hypothetical protein
MITRGLLLAAIAAAACACASTAPDGISQRSFYVVGDNAPVLNVSAGPSGQTDSQFSIIKRIYWFFAGR